MEKHHRLKRDPTWDPNGCNICGKLGHQAASCPQGTVDWEVRCGDEKTFMKWFRTKHLSTPAPVPAYEAIAKRAVEWSERKRKAEEEQERREQEWKRRKGEYLAQGLDPEEEERKRKEGEQKKRQEEEARKAREGAGAGAGGGGSAGKGPWVAVNQKGTGKVYYWNRMTNATVWKPPPGFEEGKEEEGKKTQGV